ncbi:MAG TPA: TonB-dependent receptor [Pyrinomonadaceae bacterium]
MKRFDRVLLPIRSVGRIPILEARPGSIFLRLIGLLIAGTFAISAQTTTSTIEGTVRDPNGAVVAGAQVKATSPTLGTERTVVTDSNGFYRLVSLPAGDYTLTVTQGGFAATTSQLELLLNRTATLDIRLQVEGVGGTVTVTSDVPLLTTDSPATGTTVTPREIEALPVNGREYLDLLQLVPGTAINRQSSGDNANPVLGERSGNNNFYIDGQPNKNTVSGGPAASFNQETIAEFQVLTAGYKAEFGQASGAQVNVITKSGGNSFHGGGSFFHRNDAFDSSNSLDSSVTEAPELTRYDYSVALGGPILKDRIFFFGSAERIEEDRGIDFTYPPLPAALNDLIHAQEDPFDAPRRYRETRGFLKLNQNFGRHQLTQQVNYTNENTKGIGGGLPSTRTNTGARYLLLGFGDTMMLGDQANPWIVTLRGGYRGEPSSTAPTIPDIVGTTRLNSFSAVRPCPPATASTFFAACPIFGDLTAFNFGNASTPSFLDQRYTSLSASANKLIGDHDLKFGWQFLKTKVDGLLASTVSNQIFALASDYVSFGRVDSGPFLLAEVGGSSPEDNEIHLNNNYNGLYVQDDWRILRNLTVNLGVRWDHDSEFSDNSNFSPRLGVAWALNPKTIIRAQYGKFFDQFRLGLVSQVPAFGGADVKGLQFMYFPRGLYGSPSTVTSIGYISGIPGHPCFSHEYTDAQVTAGNMTCVRAPGFPVVPMIGVDRLNNVVAPGHAPIPANAVINISNVQQLSGLSPDQYLTAAAAAIGQPNGYFIWGRFGVLANRIIPEAPRPVAVDATFETPHTVGFTVGFQRELTSDMVVEVNYHHRKMNNLLGTRLSNLTFQSRVFGRSFDPPGSPELPTFGPFYEGKYDALVMSFNKRLSNRYQLGASYTWASATDNNMGINANPNDHYIGIVPSITQGSNSNANGSFTATNGRFVPQAGTFHNGPDLDKGPSNLALDHIFTVNGLVQLPWQFQISGIFRAQSGFHFSRFDESSTDWDGNGNFTGIDVVAGRNAFTAPPFVNLDLRFSKQFNVTDRVKLDVLFEFFNVFNRQNPASVQNRADSPLRPTLRPFGTADQVLPGREGQFGVRVSF